MCETLPLKDGYRNANGTSIRRTKIRKKNREENESARATIALAHQAIANARQLIKEAAEIFQYNQARRERKVEQGQGQEDITQMEHSHIAPAFVINTGWRHSAAEVYRVRRLL